MNEIISILHSKESVSFVNAFQSDTGNIKPCIDYLMKSSTQEIQLFASKSLLKLVKIVYEKMPEEEAHDLGASILSILFNKAKKNNAVLSFLGETLGLLSKNYAGIANYFTDALLTEKSNPIISMIALKEIIHEYSSKTSLSVNGRNFIKQSSVVDRIYEYAKEFLDDSECVESASLLLQQIFSIDANDKNGEILVNQNPEVEYFMTSGKELNILFSCYQKYNCYETLRAIFYLASSRASSFDIHRSTITDDENLTRKQVFDCFFSFAKNVLESRRVFNDERSSECFFKMLFALSRNVTEITDSMIPVLNLTFDYFHTLSIRGEIPQLIIRFVSKLLIATSNQSLNDSRAAASKKASEFIMLFFEKLFSDAQGVTFAKDKEDSCNLISDIIPVFHSLIFDIMMKVVSNEPNGHQLALFIYLTSLFITQQPINGVDLRFRHEKKILIMNVMMIESNITEHSDITLEKAFCSFVYNFCRTKFSRKEELIKEKSNIETDLPAEEVAMIRRMENEPFDELITNALIQDLMLSLHCEDDAFVENVLKCIFVLPSMNEETFTFLIDNEELDSLIKRKQRTVLYSLIYRRVFETQSYDFFYQRLNNFASFDEVHFNNFINNLVGMTLNFVENGKIVNKKECITFLNWFLGERSHAFIEKLSSFIGNYEIVSSALKFWRNICAAKPVFGKSSSNGVVLLAFSESLVCSIMPSLLESEFSDEVVSLFKNIMRIVRDSLSIEYFPYHILIYYHSQSIRNLIHSVVDFIAKFGIEQIIPYPKAKLSLLQCLTGIVKNQIRTVCECENDIIPIAFDIALRTLNDMLGLGNEISNSIEFVSAKELMQAIYNSRLFSDDDHIIVEHFSEQFSEFLCLSFRYYLKWNQGALYLIPINKLRFVLNNFPDSLPIVHQQIMSMINETAGGEMNAIFERFASLIEDESSKPSQLEKCIKEMKALMPN